METLFARHKPKKGIVGLMLAGSLVLHGGLVGIASLWTSPQPEEHTVIIGDWTDNTGGGPTPGKTIDSPSETPEPTVKPDIIELPVPTPPISEDPLMPEPAEQTPTPRKPVSSKPASVNYSASGPTSTRAASGTPGNGSNAPGGNRNSAAAAITGAWVMPHPPYLRMLNASRITGTTTVRITTDAAGRISNVVIVKSTGNPALDNHTLSYVRNNWHGPANASRTTEFVYELR